MSKSSEELPLVTYLHEEVSDYVEPPDGVAYTNHKGGITLEWTRPDRWGTPKVYTAEFYLEDFDRFVALVRGVPITRLDCVSKMVGYSWPEEWQHFINDAFIKVWTIQ